MWFFCLNCQFSEKPGHLRLWMVSKGYAILFLIPIFFSFCCCLVAKLYLTLCIPFGLKHARLSCPSLSPRACSNSKCALSWWCHPTISSFVTPFSSCLQSFPASGSFPVSQFFVSGGQSIASFFILHLFVSNQECITDLKQCFSLKLIILWVLK